MTFVQVIEFRTDKLGEHRQIEEEWWRATEGKRTLRRELLARDHADPHRYYALAFFDSYESAMENSKLPETSAAAEQHMKLSDDEPVFRNLDILDERG